MPLMLFFGTNIDLKPSFSASPMRWSMRVTWRISPERPPDFDNGSPKSEIRGGVGAGVDAAPLS